LRARQGVAIPGIPGIFVRKKGKEHMRYRALQRFGGVLAVSVFAPVLHAAIGTTDNYPTRPVRWIVPFPPAGSNDIVGRVVAQPLGERLGKQVVIDNRAGGNSIIGTDMVAKSAPDGYNLIMVSTSFTTNPIIHKLPYDSLKDFDWVAFLGFGPNVLVVNNSLPAKTVQELVALAKAKPLIYASTGVGSNAQFCTELFKHMTGTNMTHVPYKGGGPAMIGVIAGETHLILSSLIQTIGHIRSGKLRALATTGEKRSVILPDVPTISEAGVPGYATANWWGVAVARGTPQSIVQRLNREMNAVISMPEVEKRLINEGAEPSPKTPEALGRHVAAEMAKWVNIAKIAGIKGE
jgi:tripartite-type tricarboxylate transporter receptor subunit TctC